MDWNSVEIDKKWRELRAGDLVNARLWLFEYYRDYSHYIAKSIYFRSKHAGFEMEDLIQWAEIGLLEAIDRYNWERKVNFRTYAGFRIKGSVLNGMAKYSEKSSYYEFLSKLNADRFQFHLKSVNSANGTLNELVGAVLDFGYIHILENFWQLEETLEINSPYYTPEYSAFVSEINGHISKLPKLSQKI
ncbi:sigma-70 family RNA polymerase sigma factor, partial [Microbulbifer rhizosphaerae]